MCAWIGQEDDRNFHLCIDHSRDKIKSDRIKGVAAFLIKVAYLFYTVRLN